MVPSFGDAGVASRVALRAVRHPPGAAPRGRRSVVPARPRRHDLARRRSPPSGPVTLRITPATRRCRDRARGMGERRRLDARPRPGDARRRGRRHATSSRATSASARPGRRNPHWRVTKTRLVLEALVASCLEQKVTGQEAWTGWRSSCAGSARMRPGPARERGMKMMPSAEALTRIPSWEWLRCHVDGARSRPIVRAARVADSLQRTVDQPAADVEQALRSLPGIGEWTAAEIRQRAHGDADAVSFGDYHIATHVGLGDDRRGDDRRADARLARARAAASLSRPARRHDPAARQTAARSADGAAQAPAAMRRLARTPPLGAGRDRCWPWPSSRCSPWTSRSTAW